MGVPYTFQLLNPCHSHRGIPDCGFWLVIICLAFKLNLNLSSRECRVNFHALLRSNCLLWRLFYWAYFHSVPPPQSFKTLIKCNCYQMFWCIVLKSFALIRPPNIESCTFLQNVNIWKFMFSGESESVTWSYSLMLRCFWGAFREQNSVYSGFGLTENTSAEDWHYKDEMFPSAAQHSHPNFFF